MKKCSKCGYIRQTNNDSYVSPLECPKCGIVYKKYEDYLDRKRKAEEAERIAQEQAERIAQEQIEAEIEQEILKGFENKSDAKDSIKTLLIESILKLSQRSNTLHRVFSYINKVFSYIKDSKPIQWFIKYKNIIASLLFFLGILGYGLWFYLLITINVTPYENWSFFSGINPQNPREALSILFFGTFACIFIVILGFFVIKFVYNLIQMGIEGFFPNEWNPLIRSIILLLLLYCALLSVEKIKKIGLTTYYQVGEVVKIAGKHKVIVNVDVPVSPELDEDYFVKVNESKI
ncbi:MAG: hypothetical protein ACMUIU_03645 [bacterium]